VNRWDELLDQLDEITVAAADLESLAVGTEEWFDNLHVRCVTPTDVIDFGLHDSTALFVDATPALAEKIVAGFSIVRRL
jgi:hypothetical protein